MKIGPKTSSAFYNYWERVIGRISSALIECHQNRAQHCIKINIFLNNSVIGVLKSKHCEAVLVYSSSTLTNSPQVYIQHKTIPSLISLHTQKYATYERLQFWYVCICYGMLWQIKHNAEFHIKHSGKSDMVVSSKLHCVW